MTDTPGQNPAPGAGTPAAPGAGGSEHPASLQAPWAGSNDLWKLGEAGKEQPWFHSIPEEPVRQLMETKAYKNPAELAMAYHNLNKLQNGAGDVVSIPGANATPEQLNAFYSKMGRPENADKYDFKFAEGTQTDDNMVKFGKGLAFDLGLNPKQAQLMADKWQQMVANMDASSVEADRIQNEADMRELENEWGADLAANKAAGLRVVQSLGLPEKYMESIDKNMGVAAVVHLMAMIGKKSGEGSFTSNNQNSGDPNDVSGLTKEQAAAKITELQGDVEFQKSYMDKTHPGHKAAVEKMVLLFAKAG
jgi:hypothetical protein